MKMIAWLMQTVVLPILALAVLLAFVRLAIGPTLADRVIAIDLLATFGIAILAAFSVATDQTTLLDVGLLLALVSFLGTVALAQFMEREQT
jgi:multicomponent Na+:H+ antiporter subunit F